MKSSVWLKIALFPSLLALTLGGLWAPVAAAPLAQNNALTLTANAGFDGYFKDARWLPVRVTVANNGPDTRGRLEVATPAGFGGAAVVVGREVDLPTQSRREVFLYLAPEGIVSSVQVRLVAEGRDLTPPVTVPLRQLTNSDLLFGVWAGTATPYNVLADVDPLAGQAYVAQLDAGALPPLAAGLQALDVLVVSDVDTGALSSEQRAALSAWVDAGGQLLVMGGPGWQKTAAGLAALLPVTPAGTAPVSALAPLADFAAAVAVPEGEAVAVVGALTAEAVPVAGSAERWLVAARRQGFGQVVYFAVDLAFAPLRVWDGSAALFRQVLSEARDRPSWAAGLSNWSSLQSAVDALPDLQLPNPFLICGFLGLYLVVVGPLNYLILRWIKRRELAWLTIPGTVLVFSLVAYVAGYALAGDQPTLHELSIVQAWPGVAQARLDQAVGLFSPRRTTYDLEFTAGLLARPLPGSGQTNTTVRVEQAEQTRLLGVRTEIASVQTFLVQGTVPAPAFTADLRLELLGGTARLLGSVTNASDLTLADAVLLAPGGVLQLGGLAPGATRPISLALSGGRASASQGLGLLPVLPGPKPGMSSPYYSGSYDTTIDDILGSPNYYEDRRLYRRYSLLSAMLTPNAGGSTGRGGGIYLVGWAAAPPVGARVLNTAFKTEAETLYVIALPSTLQAGAGAITLPPSLMTWEVLASAANGAAAPYDATLYLGDQAAFRFWPIRPVTWTRVSELTLSLIGSSYGVSTSGTTTPEVALWDFTRAAWVPLDGLQYGVQTVEAPERFVGAGGELRAQLTNRTPDTLNVTSLEFTLTVEP